jgi:hypothetical protein
MRLSAGKKPKKTAQNNPPDPPSWVLTTMRISIAAPQTPRPHRPRRVSPSFEITHALLHNPQGWWLCVNLEDIQGATATTKENSTARAVRRHLKPIQTQVEGGKLFIRHVPDPKLPCLAQPIDLSKRRPAFFRPPSPDQNPGRVAIA